MDEHKSKQWYVVHAYSGYENFVMREITSRAEYNNLVEKIGEVVVPSEEVVEMRSGQKRKSTRKFFPGYMLVQMKLSEKTWHLVKGTPRVSGFVGNATRPPELPEEEVLRVTAQMREGLIKARPKFSFNEGDSVRVIDGPFSNFNGTVEEVKPDKSKIRVLVSIFGRATPVELDFIQVEKT